MEKEDYLLGHFLLHCGQPSFLSLLEQTPLHHCHCQMILEINKQLECYLFVYNY
jgi:hypothetical protein